MSDSSVTVNGLRLPNPFVIASGPPGTNANVIGKAFDEGWGAIPRAYMAAVETEAVDAAAMAHADLAPTSLFVDKARVDHGNSNRTVQVAR